MFTASSMLTNATKTDTKTVTDKKCRAFRSCMMVFPYHDVMFPVKMFSMVRE